MRFDPSTSEHIEEIREWTIADPYHFRQCQPEWWLTGVEGSVLAFRLMDEKGPLTYVRLDEEGEYIRIHTQFAPEHVVSKRRLVVGMIYTMRKLIDLYKQENKKGMVFNSVSSSLIAFMSKNLNFKPIGNDDYQLDFEGQ